MARVATAASRVRALPGRAKAALGLALALIVVLVAGTVVAVVGGDGGGAAGDDTGAAGGTLPSTTLATGDLDLEVPDGWQPIPVPALGFGLAVPPGWEAVLLSPDGLSTLAGATPAIPGFVEERDRRRPCGRPGVRRRARTRPARSATCSCGRHPRRA